MRLSPSALAIAAGLCLLASGPAAAQQPAPASLERVTVAGRKGEASPWFRAESQRFVVYSDAREDDVAQLLDNLEKLDHLLRLYTQPAGQPGQPQPRLTLYYASQPSALRETASAMRTTRRVPMQARHQWKVVRSKLCMAASNACSPWCAMTPS